MTNPVTTKDQSHLDCPTCGQGHEGPAAAELRAKLIEQRPSKDQLKQANELLDALMEFAYEQGFHECGYNPAKVLNDEIERLERENADLETRVIALAMQPLTVTCESCLRLRTTLAGIASCSTCEACRGAATLALGGATSCDCWETVNALIKPGQLPGNGCDKSAERNGLILAANALLAKRHPSEDGQ